MIIPKLETKRLILRPLIVSDAKAITKYLQEPIFHKILSDLPNPYTRDDAKKYIKKSKNKIKRKYPTLTFGLYSKELKEIIGIQSFGPIKNNRCHTGSFIGKPFWRKGLSSEARIEILKYLFNTLKLHKICCEVRGYNIRSQKYIEKIGFKRQGIFRKNLKINNKWIDIYYYEILKEEFNYKKLIKKYKIYIL